jgi:hypothetical protein
MEVFLGESLFADKWEKAQDFAMEMEAYHIIFDFEVLETMPLESCS